MKIVVLDGHTLNPGDLEWSPLRSLGPCEIFDRSGEHEVVPRAADAEVVLTNKTPLPAEAINAISTLRYIGVLATGYNMVDVEAATRRGVLVTNVPTYGTLSVAQMVFAHLLHLVHDVGGYAEGVRRGRWSASKDFCYWDSPLHELHGRTMGIVGYGRIGRATGAIAAAFGMRVLACDPSRAEEEAAAADWVSLEELLRRSDVISLHCPLTPETRGMIRSKQLGLMKPSAFLINTSRGALVDERALADALNSGALAGAGLDVLAQEPPEATNPLLRARNCQITPHLAWATREARERLLREVAGNLAAWMHGTPRNVVNHPLQSGRARSRA